MTEKICQLYEEEQVGKVRGEKNSTIQQNARTRMGHSRNTHTDGIKTAGRHTNKQPTDITHCPSNDNNSHPNINNIGTHQDLHPGNSNSSNKHGTIGKSSYHEDQPHQVHAKHLRILQNSKASSNHSDQYDQSYQSHNPTTNKQQ